MSRPAYLLERLGTLIQQAVREDAARHDLLPVHLQVLEYLAQANHYSDIAAAVGEYLGTTRGTVSQTIAVLERRQLLTKSADEGDGRTMHLHLTDAGRAIVTRSWSQRMQKMLGDNDSATESLVALVATLADYTNQSAFGVCSQCSYFRPRPNGGQCGLTGDPLVKTQTLKICREWRSPTTGRTVISRAGSHGE
jgi:MarR family transcriptional regulator, negative regulator of the multidrug operon emrRAB